MAQSSVNSDLIQSPGWRQAGQVFTLFVLAQGQVTAGLASILNATTPLWTVIVAHIFTQDERLSYGKLAGLLLGFVGVTVIAGGDRAGRAGGVPAL